MKRISVDLMSLPIMTKSVVNDLVTSNSIFHGDQWQIVPFANTSSFKALQFRHFDRFTETKWRTVGVVEFDCELPCE